jgi:AraC-like DNA-binding protein
LAAQDCSYRDLSMAVRHERACTLLQEGRLSVGEIAKSLGYTHTSNFIRAFKGQTGLSPLQFV